MRWQTLLAVHLLASELWTLPEGLQILSGEANLISVPQCLEATVSDRAILEWNQFSIPHGETVRFLQPSVSSVVLNRVVGSDLSEIFGTLQANGRIYLINPHGVIVGENACIDTASFLVSTLDIADADFLEGKDLSLRGDSTASIVQLGTIHAREGDIAVLAHQIEQKGTLQAPNGSVSLIAGHDILLKPKSCPLLNIRPDFRGAGIDNGGVIEALNVDLQSDSLWSHACNQVGEIHLTEEKGSLILSTSGGGLHIGTQARLIAPEGNVSVSIQEGAESFPLYHFGSIDVSGSQGGTIQIQVPKLLNGGECIAEGRDDAGGNVSITVGDIFSTLQSGRASVNGKRGGNISLFAPHFFSSGTYEAKGEQGGSIHLLGESIALVAADLSTVGQDVGGEILIGGDFQGKNPEIPNASNVHLNQATKVDASGANQGGRIIVWSEEKTENYATLSAKGGQGAFIEVSSHGNLLQRGATEVPEGNLLLDPQNITIDSSTATFPFFSFVDPHAGSGTGFGTIVLALGNGNVVVTKPNDNFAATAAGAVYLYNGATGALISTLTGSSANDQIGLTGVTALTGNNNYVIRSNNWSLPGPIAAVGAVTWGNGTTGVSGVVSAANSLIGSTANDQVGSATVAALTNGNYVVRSPLWDRIDGGALSNAGAATWGNGSTGIAGTVSIINSLIGSTASDQVSSTAVTALTNGNYVVGSSFWSRVDGGALSQVGAATWGNGSIGITGTVSIANSLIGSTASDRISNAGVVALTNGNYVVGSGLWSRVDGGALSNVGAATWGNGSTGITGSVSVVNSLIGSSAFDTIAFGGITALQNGNYVVNSAFWSRIDGGALQAVGAATWGNGSIGITGTVSVVNSLIGFTQSNQVSFGGVTALTNGNYVVSSPLWSTAQTQVGAATWGNGSTGVTGTVSLTNSLIGFTPSDQVSSGGVTALTNGNYVVSSPVWSPNTLTQVGAATWGNGSTGVTGTVSLTNSLIGFTPSDQVSSGGVTALTNGNYVVSSPLWDKVDGGALANAGAATWGNGSTGITGLISVTTSLIGSTASDQISSGGITALTNGNYVVRSPAWSRIDGGALSQVGAATWGNGSTGIAGTVSIINSLIGSTASDQVSSTGITTLVDGSYVVSSANWDRIDGGALINAGAATWSKATAGITGTVSAANSVIGTISNSGMTQTVADSTENTFVCPFVTEGAIRVGLPSAINSAGAFPFFSFIDPHAGSGSGFGTIVLVLGNGNVVVTKPNDNFAATAAGAVYLYNGVTGALISTLTGSSANDQIGITGVTALTGNNNYVIRSSNWSLPGPIAAVGAVTWGNGTTGVSGVVSAANSLIGSTANDQVGSSTITALTNGNYVVGSPNWDRVGGGALANVGAATWGNGSTGITGTVSVTNSLIGSTASDQISNIGIVALTNGNYVVCSDFWDRIDGGVLSNVGAATWGNGSTGITGTVSIVNSLIGSTASDQVCASPVTALTNGNYVVSSPVWSRIAGGALVGAVTWGNGTTGITGTVSIVNSLIGSTVLDTISLDGIVALQNGNYVVRSSTWQRVDGGAVTSAGAATWGNGSTGTTGTVSVTNSLIGSTASDQISSGAVTALTNGNYVVSSPLWDRVDGGALANAGAATWGNGSTGTSGTVSVTNSLIGSTASDQLSSGGVAALTNGNYVVSSPLWDRVDGGALANAGAATWGNGSTGTSGTVSVTNSLIGSTASDQISSGAVTALTNGNYVVRSPLWDRVGGGALTDAGAATWGNGSTGTSGTVSVTNSLIGSTASDQISSGGVAALTNGNYVVSSPLWDRIDGGALSNAGAATWGSGTAGITGTISIINSLIGSTASDQVSSTGITALTGGSYVVSSANWSRITGGALASAGAATWGNGATGITGTVSVVNSVIGTISSSGMTRAVGDSTENTFVCPFVTAGAVQVGLTTSTQMTYALAASQSITMPSSFLTTTLNAGTNVTLQANNDITVTSALSFHAGNLGLSAGRSVLLNANITTGGANLTVVANDTLANGVIDADRTAGTAVLSVANGVTINAGGGNISLSLLDGAGKTNTASGNITIGVSSSLTTSSTGTIAINAQVHDLVISNAATLQTNSGNIQLTAGGNIQIGAGDTLNSTLGSISFGTPVLLSGLPSTVTATVTAGNAITFSSTIDGSLPLSLQSGTGDITLLGSIGGTTPLTNLSFLGGHQIDLGAGVSVTGANPLVFSLPVNLLTNSLITSNDVAFSSTLDGAHILRIFGGTGTTTFTGAIGGTVALDTVIVGAGTVTQSSTAKTTVDLVYIGTSAINVHGNITASAGSIAMTGPLAITNAPTFDAGMHIVLNNTVNGATSLTLQAGTGGNISFSGAVGNTAPLTNLIFSSGHEIDLGANVTVTGANPLVFSLPVSLIGTSTITSNNANVGFSSTLDGASTLMVVGGTGVTTFTGAIGEIEALNSLSAAAATVTQSSTAKTTGALSYTGSSAINVQGNITTSGGAISVTGPLAITSASTFDSTNAGGVTAGANISFSNTVNGATSLTLQAGTGGNISFSGAVGNTAPLTNLIFSSGHQIDLGANVTVTGANPLVFSLPVSLIGISTITSNNANVGFSSTLDGASTLMVVGGTGVTTFTGAIGGTTALNSLSAAAATVTQSSTAKTTGALSYTGSSAINVQGNITTSGGAISMTGPLAITSAPTFDSTNAGGVTAGANISFSNTVNGATSLTLQAGTGGIVSFSGAVGNTAPLTNLSFLGGHQINLGANITVTGANPLVFSLPVNLTGTSTVTSNNANLTFSATLDGAEALTLVGGSGTVTLTGIVGGTAPLSSLTASGGSIHIQDNVSAFGNTLLFNGPVVLDGDVVFTDTGSGITFLSSITGPTRNLSMNASAGQVFVEGTVDVLTLDCQSRGSSTFGGEIIASGNIAIASTENSIQIQAITSNAGSISLQPSSGAISNQLSPGDLMPKGILILGGNLTAPVGTISLSSAGRTELLSVATITAEPTGGHLSITAGTLTIGDYETVTVFGDLSLITSGSAHFGDVIATDSLTIVSGSNEIFLRNPGRIYDYLGNLYEDSQTNCYATAAVPSITPFPTFVGSGAPAEIDRLPFFPDTFQSWLIYAGHLLTFSFSPSFFASVFGPVVVQYDRSAAESFNLWNTDLFGPYLSWGEGAPLYTPALGSMLLPSLVNIKGWRKPLTLKRGKIARSMPLPSLVNIIRMEKTFDLKRGEI